MCNKRATNRATTFATSMKLKNDVRLWLDTRKPRVKTGDCPVKLVLTAQTTMRISTGIYCMPDEWDGSMPAPSTFVALCFGFTLTERLGCFAESYNNFSRYGNAYGVDFGFNYMVGERVQLDLAANLDVCHPKQCWAVSFGVAWQINNPRR